MYQVYLKNGHTYEVTDKEYKFIVASDDDMVVIPRIDATISKVMISDISKRETRKRDMLEERAKMTEGYLHDGSRAVKQFGTWMDPTGLYGNNGQLLTRFDPTYYPEVARDAVASLELWEEIKHLPREERLEAMFDGGKPAQVLNGGVSSIGEILETM